MKTLQTMSTNADTWIRRSAFIMIGIVATSSGILSWNGLAYLGQQAGISYGLSFLLPLSIDGMLLLGGTVIVHSTLTNQSTIFGWLMTFLGVCLSIYGNISSVEMHDIQSQIVHAVPPLALFLSVEGLLRIIKHRISTTQALALAKEKAEQRALLALATTENTALKQAKAVKSSARKAMVSSEKDMGTVVANPRSRVSSDDEEVSIYGLVLSSLDTNVSKVGMVEAILREFPDARSTHIALAMGVDSRGIGTAVARAKAKIAKDNAGIEGSVTTDSKVLDPSVGVLAMA